VMPRAKSLNLLLCILYLCINTQTVNATLGEATNSAPLPLPVLPESLLVAQNTFKEQNFISSSSLQQVLGTRDVSQQKMQIEAQDPLTGETIQIDIRSDKLMYSPETGQYVVSGDVYIIIPERELEILADEVTYSSDSANMVATGNVFIIRNQNKIIGGESSEFDLKEEVFGIKNPRTVSDTYRIQAKEGQHTKQYTIMNHGRLILNSASLAQLSSSTRRRGFRVGQGAFFSDFSARALRERSRLRGTNQFLGSSIGTMYSIGNVGFLGDNKSPDDQIKIMDKPVSPNDITSADFAVSDSSYHLKAKKIEIQQQQDNFNEVTLKNVLFKYRNVPLAYAPTLEFGHQEETNYMTYLGPDIGYNVDYGGFYAGPGWDFRFLDGWMTFSPTLMYGGGYRLKSRGSQPEYVDPKLGVGLLGHFRSYNHRADFGYSSIFREPIVLSQHRLFGQSSTRLRFALNQFYNNGFYNAERPHMIAEITDSRVFNPSDKWLLRTYASAGVAKDEFFPSRQRVFFVRPQSNDPTTTTRLQFQGQLASKQPLIHLGSMGGIGVLAQTRLSTYGTGDFYGIFQGGPSLTLVKGPFFSQTNYLYGTVTGKTPFVFDSFYFGQNNIQTINSIDVGKYITIGTMHNINLDQDNVRGALVVDQRIFFSVGSKNLRFSASFDTIQKRAFFGITMNPDGGPVIMDFDSFNIYQPGFNARDLPRAQIAKRNKKTKSASNNSNN
jgi:hypothetical protein